MIFSSSTSASLISQVTKFFFIFSSHFNIWCRLNFTLNNPFNPLSSDVSSLNNICFILFSVFWLVFSFFPGFLPQQHLKTHPRIHILPAVFDQLGNLAKGQQTKLSGKIWAEGSKTMLRSRQLSRRLISVRCSVVVPACTTFLALARGCLLPCFY